MGLTTTYVSCLKRISKQLDTIESFLLEHSRVVSQADKDNFDELKTIVRAHQEATKGLAIWKVRWATPEAQAKASDIETRLKLFDRAVRNDVKNTYSELQDVKENMKELRAVNGSLEELQIANVTLITTDGTRHSITVNLQEVNKGGFGTILRGSCVTLGGAVALKRATASDDANVSRRFEREALLWSNLNHPNILPYHGVCDMGAIPHIVSPYVEDPDLISYVKSHPAEKPRIILDIAKALAYLHSLNPRIIHADIKSQNILITSAGHVYICDFGLTKFEGFVTTSMSVSGACTLEWTSPERLICSAEDNVSSRTKEDDVYAFGITMAEIILEGYPYGEERLRPADLYAGVAFGKLRPRGGSGDLWKVAERCWAASPEDRPSMAEVVSTIEAILSTSALTTSA